MISWTFENINVLAMPNQKLCTVGGGVSDKILKCDKKHSPPILAEMLDIGYIAVLAVLMDLMVKYSINHHKIDF